MDLSIIRELKSLETDSYLGKLIKILNYLQDAEEPERDYSMLPDDFDFALMPEGT